MRRILSPLTVAAVALATPALAQMYPGDDVIVNPAAIPESVPPYAGQSDLGLHRPNAHHHLRHRHQTMTAASAAPQPAAAADANTGVAPAKSQPKKGANAQPAPTDESGDAVPFNFGDDNPAPQSPAPKMASREMPPAQTDKANDSDAGTKHGAIIFEHNATNPQPEQVNGIKLLAGDLNAALEAGATEIELVAFGGAPGDKSSDARRTALKRALSIRQILIDNGVPASRIVTKAMGGATDKGEPDRVDVYVRSG